MKRPVGAALRPRILNALKALGGEEDSKFNMRLALAVVAQLSLTSCLRQSAHAQRARQVRRLVGVFAMVNTASMATAQSPSRLGSLIVWHAAGTSTTTYTLSFAPALDSAIRRVVPNWRPRRPNELMYETSYDASKAATTHTAIVADLDHDGRLEAVLMGVIRGDDRVTADASLPGKVVHQTLILLGIREAEQGFEVKELLRKNDLLWTGPDYVDAVPTTQTLLTLDGLTLQGKFGGTIPWVRWQDADCKSEGFIWTVRAKAWVRAKSPCSYGD